MVFGAGGQNGTLGKDPYLNPHKSGRAEILSSIRPHKDFCIIKILWKGGGIGGVAIWKIVKSREPAGGNS